MNHAANIVLLCYDGSTDAQAAIDRAGELMPGSDATVLVLWETLLETMTRTGPLGMGFGFAGAYGDDTADAAMEQRARDTAADGVQRATAAGFSAQPRIVNRHHDIAADILTVADNLPADVIVLGTRGLSGVKSLMLGSVSHAVLHHADRPVLVIPSPALAAERHQWAGRSRLTAGIA
jgi:nucleotide-binding universal stress UspA family protein